MIKLLLITITINQIFFASRMRRVQREHAMCPCHFNLWLLLCFAHHEADNNPIDSYKCDGRDIINLSMALAYRKSALVTRLFKEETVPPFAVRIPRALIDSRFIYTWRFAIAIESANVYIFVVCSSLSFRNAFFEFSNQRYVNVQKYLM